MRDSSRPCSVGGRTSTQAYSLSEETKNQGKASSPLGLGSSSFSSPSFFCGFFLAPPFFVDFSRKLHTFFSAASSRGFSFRISSSGSDPSSSIHSRGAGSQPFSLRRWL